MTSREGLYTPPPPHFWPEDIFQGGGGVYFEAPHGRIFVPAPPLLCPSPPALRGYFQGWGGLYNIWPQARHCAESLLAHDGPASRQDVGTSSLLERRRMQFPQLAEGTLGA